MFERDHIVDEEGIGIIGSADPDPEEKQERRDTGAPLSPLRTVITHNADGSDDVECITSAGRFYVATTCSREELFIVLAAQEWEGVDVTVPIIPERLPYSFADTVAAEHRDERARRTWRSSPRRAL